MKKQGLVSRLTALKQKHILSFINTTTGINLDTNSCYWQPIYLVAARTLLFLSLVIISIVFHLVPGGLMHSLVGYFKFEAIFKFTAPDRGFYNTLSLILILILIAYYGFIFIRNQVESLFSSLVIDEKNRQLYLVKSRFFTYDIKIIPLHEIPAVTLKQNILYKLVNLGTLVFHKTTAEQIRFYALFNARNALSTITRLRVSVSS
jgi:hypothetical protein